MVLPVVLRREVRSRRPLVMVMMVMMATRRPAVRVFARTGGSLPEFATSYDTCHVLLGGGGLVHHRVRTVVLG